MSTGLRSHQHQMDLHGKSESVHPGGFRRYKMISAFFSDPAKSRRWWFGEERGYSICVPCSVLRTFTKAGAVESVILPLTTRLRANRRSEPLEVSNHLSRRSYRPSADIEKCGEFGRIIHGEHNRTICEQWENAYGYVLPNEIGDRQRGKRDRDASINSKESQPTV